MCIYGKWNGLFWGLQTLFFVLMNFMDDDFLLRMICTKWPVISMNGIELLVKKIKNNKQINILKIYYIRDTLMKLILVKLLTCCWRRGWKKYLFINLLCRKFALKNFCNKNQLLLFSLKSATIDFSPLSFCLHYIK